MSKSKAPKIVKDTFYLTWSDSKKYNELTIKKNTINKQLENIYNNNIWNLKTQSEELDKKIEYKGIFNGFINSIYFNSQFFSFGYFTSFIRFANIYTFFNY